MKNLSFGTYGKSGCLFTVRPQIVLKKSIKQEVFARGLKKVIALFSAGPQASFFPPLCNFVASSEVF
jgi:hypothetical protein